MPHHRYKITLSKKQILQLAEEQIALQVVKDDGGYSSERSVKELLKIVLYFRIGLVSLMDNKDFAALLEDQNSPEYRLFNVLDNISRSNPVLDKHLRELLAIASRLKANHERMPINELEHISTNMAGVQEVMKRIPLDYTLERRLQFAEKHGLKEHLIEFANRAHLILTNNNEDATSAITKELAIQLYIKEKREPFRPAIVLSKTKDVLNKELDAYVDELFNKIPAGIIKDVAHIRHIRTQCREHHEEIEARLSLIKQLPDHIMMDLYIPVDELYDIQIADFAIRSKLNGNLAGPIMLENRCWLGLFPIINSNNPQHANVRHGYQENIIRELKSCALRQEIYIAILSRAGASGGHYMLFSLIPDPKNLNAYHLHCVNSIETKVNNDTVMQFCEILQKAGINISNINNPNLDYIVMQVRDIGCGVALVENVFLKITNALEKTGSGHTRCLTEKDEDALRIEQTVSILRRPDMLEPIIRNKQFPVVLINAGARNPDVADIRLVPTGEILKVCCDMLFSSNATIAKAMTSFPTIEGDTANGCFERQKHILSAESMDELNQLILVLDIEIQNNATAFFRKFSSERYDKEKKLKEAKKFFLTKLRHSLLDPSNVNISINVLIRDAILNTNFQTGFENIDVLDGNSSRVASFINKINPGRKDSIYHPSTVTS